LELERGGCLKLLGSGRGADPNPLSLTTSLAQDTWIRCPDPRLMGPHQYPIFLGLTSSPNSNGFGLQPDPRLLGLAFKRHPKLLGIVFQSNSLKRG